MLLQTRETTPARLLTQLEQDLQTRYALTLQVSVIFNDSLLNTNSAPPAFLVELPEKTTVELGGEISFVCHVECSPLCGLEWLVDGKPVEGEEGDGGDRWDQREHWEVVGDQWDRGERWDREGDFVVDLEELEEDVEIGQFTSVTSTLTWLNPNLEKTEFSVECRQGWF